MKFHNQCRASPQTISRSGTYSHYVSRRPTNDKRKEGYLIQMT